MTSALQRLFTAQEKLDECNRELVQRQRVYGWMVRQGKMTKGQAARQIRLMTAIRDDYADQVGQGPLFQQLPTQQEIT